MQYAIIRLSDRDDHTKHMDLKFKLLQHSFMKKWIACVLHAQQKQYPISEPWAMYDLNDSMNSEFLVQQLNRFIKEVDKEVLLFGIELNDINDQDTLNRIHAIFEQHHGKLDEWKTNPLFKNKSPHFRNNLSQINQFVHSCETVGSDSPRIRIVWFDLPKHENLFSNNDYKLFTLEKKWGSLYHHYCDVGKNIEALADIPDAHHHDIVPNLHFSADCVATFSERDPETVEKIRSMTQQYKLANKELLRDKGYVSNDPRLTCGKIELARLETDLSQQEVMDEIKKYNHIQSFFLI